MQVATPLLRVDEQLGVTEAFGPLVMSARTVTLGVVSPLLFLAVTLKVVTSPAMLFD